MKTRSEMNLTEGNLFFKCIKFAFPLMLTSIFQLLYTTVDLWTVSKYGGGPLSMSAVGSNGSLINLIITLLISLATGANVCISVAKGANDKEKANRILHTAYFVAIVGGIIFAIIGFFLAPKLLGVMKTPDSIRDKATTYLRIYFLGIPLLAVYNFGSQMLRALGDSKRPLYFLCISGLINVFFDLLFVIKFDMDVAGVALATVISELISATLVTLWFRFFPHTFANLRFKQIRVHKQELKEILKVGIPAGIQGMAFSLPNVFIQSSLYTITNYYIDGVFISQENIIAGSSASGQIEGYQFVMLDAFAIAIISFTGQNYGAQKVYNIKKCFWIHAIWMFIFWVISFSICYLFPEVLLSIFITPSDDIIVENALAAGKQRLLLMSATYLFDGIMDMIGGYMKGMKRSLPPAIVTLIGCTGTRILFILTIFKLETFHTVFWLYAAYPISWILIDIIYIPLTFIVQKQQFDKLIDPIYTKKAIELKNS